MKYIPAREVVMLLVRLVMLVRFLMGIIILNNHFDLNYHRHKTLFIDLV